MRSSMIRTVLALAAIGSLVVPAAALADKHSPEHNAAVKHCGEVYEAGVRAAHAPGSPTGAVRHRTMHRLAEEKKACIARAPK